MPEFKLNDMLNADDLDTILQALHERRTRLINIAADGRVLPASEPTLRARVADTTRMIRRLTKAQVVVLR